MRSSCRSAFGHLYDPVELTTLLYKEVPELPRQPWRERPSASSELFRRGPGAAARNLATGGCGVSW
jgi:hypothetical protein